MKNASLGSDAVFGYCQLGCFAFLIPWILAALIIELFPGFTYGLAERWICPDHSSIQIQGTQG